MNKNHFFFIIYFSLSICLITSCSDEEDRLKIDVDHIKIDLNIDRMEQDLFDNSKTPEEKHQFLIKKYGLLYESFFAEMIRSGNPYSPESPEILNAFINDTYIKSIIKDLNSEFKDFTPYEIELTKVFKHYKYYFPDSTIPTITTFFSYFNSNVLETDNRLGIGIDMYLGKNNSIVKKLQEIPQYLKNKMEKEFLVSDAMYGFLQNRFYNPTGNDLISIIIEKGLVLYLLKAMMPEAPEHILCCYTKDEYSWCINNEKEIWEYLADHELIYSKDQRTINNYITIGPTTKGHLNSPSRIGAWLGFQIIKDHVNKHNLEVLDLLKEKNVRTILKSYNPYE